MSLSNSKRTVPESVVKATRAVLLSSVKGVSLRNFSKDYINLLGEGFPWRKLGYVSAKDLLKAMPDTVRFEYSEKDAGYRLYGIGTKEMFMPSWVVKAQGKIKKPSKNAQTSSMVSGKLSKSAQTFPVVSGKPSKSAQTSSPVVSGVGKREDCDGLVYNARGLVTVYISWEPVNCQQKEEIIEMKGFLTHLLSRVAHPAEVVVPSGCYAFVRFSLLKDAQRVMEKMNGLKIRNFHFKAMAAKEKMPRGREKPVIVSSKVTKTSPKAKRKNSRLRSNQLTSNRSLLSHDNHVTSFKSGGTLSSIEPCANSYNVTNDKTNGSCDHHTSSCDQSCICNGHSQMPRLESVAFSDSESDSSDVEWDYDLLDNPERHLIGGRMTDFEGESEEERGVALSGMQLANKWGLTPIRVTEVVSPDQIWIQFGVSPEVDLDCISSAISNSNPDPLTPQALSAGVCCAMLMDKRPDAQEDVYRRARVTSVTNAQFVRQVQSTLELIDTGCTYSGVALSQLYSLPRHVAVGVITPLCIPTAIVDLHSTFNYGEEWFPLDKQLLWEHLRLKTVFAKVVKKPSKGQVGVVDLYFDPAGDERVCDFLIKKGLFLSSKQPVLKVPPPAPPTRVANPSQASKAKLSHIVSVIKKSVEEKCSAQKLRTNNGVVEANSLHSTSHLRESADKSEVEQKGGSEGGCGFNGMPPLERCSVSDDDWWTDESDDRSSIDLWRLSSRSHVTNICRTGHVTDDDDW